MLNFADLELEVARKVQIAKGREEFNKAQAERVLAQKLQPFLNYLRSRLIASCEISNEPRRIGETYWFDINIRSENRGSFSTSHTACAIGVTPKAEGHLAWFVDEVGLSDEVEFYREVLRRLIASGLLSEALGQEA
jgi:hypothetical protein